MTKSFELYFIGVEQPLPVRVSVAELHGESVAAGVMNSIVCKLSALEKVSLVREIPNQPPALCNN